MFEKRQLLTKLRQELEFSRQNWLLVKQKTTDSEREWKELRDEFRSRREEDQKMGGGGMSSSESGFSDSNDKGEEEESGADQNKEEEKEEEQCNEVGGESAQETVEEEHLSPPAAITTTTTPTATSATATGAGEVEESPPSSASAAVYVPPLSFFGEVPEEHLPPLLEGPAKLTDSYQVLLFSIIHKIKKSIFFFNFQKEIYDRLVESAERSAHIVSRLASTLGEEDITVNIAGQSEEKEDEDDDDTELDDDDEDVEPRTEEDEEDGDDRRSPEIVSVDDEGEEEQQQQQQQHFQDAESDSELDDSLEDPFPDGIPAPAEEALARLGNNVSTEDEDDELEDPFQSSSPEPPITWDQSAATAANVPEVEEGIAVEEERIVDSSSSSPSLPLPPSRPPPFLSSPRQRYSPPLLPMPPMPTWTATTQTPTTIPTSRTRKTKTRWILQQSRGIFFPSSTYFDFRRSLLNRILNIEKFPAKYIIFLAKYYSPPLPAGSLSSTSRSRCPSFAARRLSSRTGSPSWSPASLVRRRTWASWRGGGRSPGRSLSSSSSSSSSSSRMNISPR